MTTEKTKPLWIASVADGKRYTHHTLAAWTKSEARALLKQILDIPRKGRLPVGLTLAPKQ